ncbi:MAG: hypothetical protein LBQ59_02375 [Candidatus Peribacteria bacterium]|nr:hypothetical protein [Candidatus Peribacteria bacterium]
MYSPSLRGKSYNSPLLVPRFPPQPTLTLPLSPTREGKATSLRMTFWGNLFKLIYFLKYFIFKEKIS